MFIEEALQKIIQHINRKKKEHSKSIKDIQEVSVIYYYLSKVTLLCLGYALRGIW